MIAPAPDPTHIYLMSQIHKLTRRIQDLEDAVLPHPGICGAGFTDGRSKCFRDGGHDGPHETVLPLGSPLMWHDPTPDCCGRGPACGACDPGPVPEWRRMVDEEIEKSRYWHENEKPMSVVLFHLSELAALHLDVDGLIDAPRALARIIAVCELQVGDGWKANPRRGTGGHLGIAWLMAPLSWEQPNWDVGADRAAAWLRHITEGAS